MMQPEAGRPASGQVLALLAALCLAGTACQQENRETQEQEREAAGVERTAGKADEAGQPGPAGTFTPREGTAEDEQGRLPAEGDQSMRIAATELFAGAARFDPNVRNPYSGDRQAIAAGERHFAAFNCAGCHAPMGGGGMGPPLSDDHWIYGSQPAQIYLSIMQGRPQGMPAWSSMLPRRTAWELVAYIETLDEVEDYAAEKGFDSNRREPAPGEDAATRGAGTDESPTGQ